MSRYSRKTNQVAGIYDLRLYGAEYHYENGSHPCTCGDDYCRCSTIEGAHVTSVNTSTIADQILGHFKPQKPSEDRTIEHYCVDRILVAQEAFKPEMYEVKVSWGYYGQEIDGTFLLQASGVGPHVQTVLALQDRHHKIEYVLDLEYNKILDAVKNKEWSIETIKMEDLNFGSKQHEKKVRKSELEMYKDWTLPRGIAIAQDGKYRLIDGYHRCAACGEEEILLIVGR